MAAAAAFAASPAAAQRTTDNVLRAAEDAFGASIGDESIGLYSTSQVRGFSPVTAGNVRIEGVYLDRQGQISNRLVSGSTIRVGLSAQGYPFPAPTGIVDYRLRSVGEKPLLSVVAALQPYGGRELEFDGQLPILGERLGVAAGGSIEHQTWSDGTDARTYNLAIIPRWRPTEDVEITPFWSWSQNTENEVGVSIITAGPYAPPRIKRGVFFGQDWAQRNGHDINTGVIGKVRLGEAWRVSGGVFRSIANNNGNFAELFIDTQPDGRATERIIADPGQKYVSTSGEFRLSRAFAEGPRLHTLHASIRARSLDSAYGGAATPIELAGRTIGVQTSTPRPDFVFGPRTQDHVRQTTFGLAYEGRWRGVGELSLGLQHADYRKTIELPGGAPTVARDQPWLPNAAAALYLRKDLAFYASYTRGLEESGLAPNNAANRNEALPAIRTRQVDGGLRWIINPKITLVAGLFDVSKPYFNTDEANRYVVLGDVRNRGAEISLAGSPVENLSIVAGAVLMKPRVTGEAVRLGRVGERPLNQPDQVLRGAAEYRIPAVPGLSVDMAVSYNSRRMASRDNLLSLDPYTNVDLGARYRFNAGGAPAMLRVQVLNVGDTYAWRIAGGNTFGVMDGRRFAASLAVDF